MAGKLAGKVALVTGGSRGIGRDICLLFAQEGASVVVVYQGNVAAANETVSEIEKKGAKAISVKGDISVAADVLAMFKATLDAFQKVDIVAHLAGILVETYPQLVNTTEEDWDRTFACNVKGAFLVSKEAAKHIGPGGRIILTSSSLTSMLLPGYGAYSASKSAVEAMAKTLAKELRGKNITVNCIGPGPIATEMFFKGKTQATIDSMAKMSPLERLGETKDIAPVFLFIASDESEWVNGQVIKVNGGTTA